MNFLLGLYVDFNPYADHRQSRRFPLCRAYLRGIDAIAGPDTQVDAATALPSGSLLFFMQFLKGLHLLLADLG